VYLGVGTEDEEVLIRRCLAGEPDAFEPLVERYHRPLYRAAVRMLGDREEARDATQTAFLKAYKGLPSCDPRRRFFSWIYRILVNDCLNVLRARHPTEPLDEDAAYGIELNNAGPADAKRRVRSAIRRLSAAQREVILLRHFAEMRYDEVAAALGISEATVKSRLFSARQRLCELLVTEKA